MLACATAHPPNTSCMARHARRYVCSYYVMHHGLDKMEDEVFNAEEVPEVDDCAAVDDGSLHNKSVKINV